MAEIGRTPQMDADYRLFRQDLKDKNLTLPQHVKLNIFGFEGNARLPIYYLYTAQYGDIPIPVYLQTDDPASLGWLSLSLDLSDPLSGLSDDSQFALFTPNDFPYNVDPNIYHWVLWSNRVLSIELVHSIVDYVMKPTWDSLAYVNEPDQQSIPEIFHAQVFFYDPPVARTDEDL